MSKAVARWLQRSWAVEGMYIYAKPRQAIGHVGIQKQRKPTINIVEDYPMANKQDAKTEARRTRIKSKVGINSKSKYTEALSANS